MAPTKLLMYGSRIPRLAARTTGGGSNASSTSGGSGDGQSVSPIVPALIAVAIFVLSALVIMKAVHSLRGGSIVPIHRKSIEDEKPQLWEVSLDEKTVPVSDAGTWSEMMPVSVGYLPTYDSFAVTRPPSVATTGSSTCSRSQSRGKVHSWSFSPPKPSAKADAMDDELRPMRVAVLIAMPTPSGGELCPPAPAYLGLAET
ncbi:hypothetical protein BN946_scf184815.g15 [Trametes cinnabarina]|uniref:Uncharacterized protein n=1 Tax=Pycnoporus cinnabarinus TaxID=5643 RepID=A0A060S7L6_PYCCI|nr:hypothetical protein BN946_scf184815.g15 [Trametes cinnabarina]